MTEGQLPAGVIRTGLWENPDENDMKEFNTAKICGKKTDNSNTKAQNRTNLMTRCVKKKAHVAGEYTNKAGKADEVREVGRAKKEEFQFYSKYDRKPQHNFTQLET